MSAPGKGEFTQIKGVRRYAFASLAVATITGLWLVLTGELRAFGVEVPMAATLALLVVGVVVGIVGITRRSDLVIGIGAVLLVLGVVPGSFAEPGLLTYGLGLLFGFAVLLMLELVYMTGRYERAQRVVERENVPDSSVKTVVVEARKTLARRAGLAALCAAGAVGLAFLLASVGPRQWRAAIETTAPLGVAVIALALAGLASLYILTRGAKFKLRREPPPKELLPDVAE